MWLNCKDVHVLLDCRSMKISRMPTSLTLLILKIFLKYILLSIMVIFKLVYFASMVFLMAIHPFSSAHFQRRLVPSLSLFSISVNFLELLPVSIPSRFWDKLTPKKRVSILYCSSAFLSDLPRFQHTFPSSKAQQASQDDR